MCVNNYLLLHLATTDFPIYKYGITVIFSKFTLILTIYLEGEVALCIIILLPQKTGKFYNL